MLAEHEKFWAFCLLGFAIVVLTLVMIFFPPPEGSQRIVDAAVGGLLLAFGAATNALFRSKSETSASEDIAKTAIDKLPPPTGEAAHSEPPALAPYEGEVVPQADSSIPEDIPHVGSSR
jgi:hypothetical protein